MPRKSLLSAAAFAAATFVATGTPSAQVELDTKKATYFTFSAPVALPSVTLAPGKYLFRLADSQANRNIVMVYTGDGSKLMSTFITMPAIRNEASDNAEVRFYETPAGSAAPIQTWWFPGQKQGWEFVYPRQQAMEIAKSSSTPVLASTANTSTGMSAEQAANAMKDADVVRIDAQGQQAAFNADAASDPRGRAQAGEDSAAVTATASAPAPASTSSPAVARSASAGNSNAPTSTSTTATVDRAEAPASADVRATTTRSAADTSAVQEPAAPTAPARDELPATATMTPLIALVGVLALTTGLLVHNRRRRFE